jgi:hypothetical protein
MQLLKDNPGEAGKVFVLDKSRKGLSYMFCELIKVYRKRGGGRWRKTILGMTYKVFVKRSMNLPGLCGGYLFKQNKGRLYYGRQH